MRAPQSYASRQFFRFSHHIFVKWLQSSHEKAAGLVWSGY